MMLGAQPATPPPGSLIPGEGPVFRPRCASTRREGSQMTGSYFPWEDEGWDRIDGEEAKLARVRYNRVRFVVDLVAIREAITRRQLREALTLAELSQEMRISRMTLWRLTVGRPVEAGTLGRIIRALDLDERLVVKRIDGQEP